MKGIIDITVRFVRAGREAYARKWLFLGVFVFVFLGSVTALGQLGLLPSASSVEAATQTVVAGIRASKPIVVAELPMKIEAPKIGLSALVVNPTAVDIAALDEELLKGAVRYPTSAKLGEAGNVVLFGHSSYLPVVLNQAYKTFNGIQKLTVGDTITVHSSGTAYTYRVKSVVKENAMNNEGIPLEISGRVLTLVTCNSFGAKEDRFVVTADFVESHPAGS